MSAFFVQVTAQQIAACVTAPDPEGFDPAWATPLEMALEALTGEACSIDQDGPGAYVATISQGTWTLVVNLPAECATWLDRRWNEDGPAGPETFRIPVAPWIDKLMRTEVIDA